MNRCVCHVTHNTCAVVPTLSAFPQHITDGNQLPHRIDVPISVLIRRCKYWHGFHFKSFSTENLQLFKGWLSNACTSRLSLHISIYTRISRDLENVSVYVIRLVTRYPYTSYSTEPNSHLVHLTCILPAKNIPIAPHSSRTFSVHPKVFKHVSLYKLLT